MPDEKKSDDKSYQDILSKWQEEQQKRLETSRVALTQLLSTRPEVAEITIRYDGSGDQGCIGDVIARDSNDNELTLHTDLQHAVEDIAYDLLAVHCGGWEINEGSSGVITIDAKTLQGTIEHDWLVTEFEHHEFEF
jgi:hypothetical protein